MRFFRPFPVIRRLFPEAVFRLRTSEKNLFLTYDDGPDPESTPALIHVLKRYDVRAVFFCNGRAAEKHPDLIASLKEAGHTIGNHGYDHVNGWQTTAKEYEANIARADQFTSGRLFRPPYGRITPRQYRMLRKTYRIIFWDIMPYDFDDSFGKEKSLELLRKKIRPGSVIVLHDTRGSNAAYITEKIIEYSNRQGYRFGML